MLRSNLPLSVFVKQQVNHQKLREEKKEKTKTPRLLSGAPVYSILLLRVASDAELQD